ncbi:MAG: Ku protein [Actinomycetota bacterium]|nr:Ku protein [Actinomycetota bacterium]
MARGIWSGSISFGLVNVPVKLYPAVRRKDLRFHQFQAGTSDRVRYKRVSEATGDELSPEQIARGYELSRGRYVMVSDDDLDSFKLEATHTIDIEEFVDLQSIDPIFYDSTYYVAPSEPTGATAKAYTLLAQAMTRRSKVAIGRVVIRTKQYLAAIRPFENALALSTMLFADEVLPLSSVEDLNGVANPSDLANPGSGANPNGREQVKPNDRELSMAAQLIDSLAAEFDPGKYHDTYREQVLQMIRSRADGQAEIQLSPSSPAPSNVVDIMAALEASLAAVRDPAAARKPAGDTAAPRKPAARGQGARSQSVGIRSAVAGGPSPEEQRSSIDSLPSREELYEEAKRRGVPGRSKMTRQQLAAALGQPERKTA